MECLNDWQFWLGLLGVGTLLYILGLGWMIHQFWTAPLVEEDEV